MSLIVACLLAKVLKPINKESKIVLFKIVYELNLVAYIFSDISLIKD